MVDITPLKGSSDGATSGLHATARRILRRAITGALATGEVGGHPFASLVTVATDMPGTPVLLLSKLARHTQNLGHDRRASLLLVAPGGEAGDPLAGARLTVKGQVMAAPDDTHAVRRFLARHRGAEAYAGFGDFGFYRLQVTGAHLVAGFGRIVDLAAGALLLAPENCAPLVEAEADMLARLNAERGTELRRCATGLWGGPDGAWRISGIDPEGADLITDSGHAARLDFPEPVSSPESLEATLAELFAQAGALR